LLCLTHLRPACPHAAITWPTEPAKLDRKQRETFEGKIMTRYNMLDHCKVVAGAAGLDTERFDLKTFRSIYATRMLRSDFDVRSVQHWMGHKSLETTMRYLVPATDVQLRLEQVGIPGVSAAGTGACNRSSERLR
jgi:integrase